MNTALATAELTERPRDIAASHATEQHVASYKVLHDIKAAVARPPRTADGDGYELVQRARMTVAQRA